METPKEIIQRMLLGGMYIYSFMVDEELARDAKVAEYIIEDKKRRAAYDLASSLATKIDSRIQQGPYPGTSVYRSSVFFFSHDEIVNIFSIVRQLKTDEEMARLFVAIEEMRDKK